MTARRRAPWPDFAGNPIYEGDTIRHPDGQTGVVVFDEARLDPALRWRVRYPDLARTSWLAHQVVDKGRAVVVTNKEKRMDYIRKFFEFQLGAPFEAWNGIPFNVATCGICGKVLWERDAVKARLPLDGAEGGSLRNLVSAHLRGYEAGSCLHVCRPKPRPAATDASGYGPALRAYAFERPDGSRENVCIRRHASGKLAWDCEGAMIHLDTNDLNVAEKRLIGGMADTSRVLVEPAADAEAQRRAAFRERCSQLLDRFGKETYGTATAKNWLRLRRDLSTELDAFLAATPMPGEAERRLALVREDLRTVRDRLIRSEAKLDTERGNLLGRISGLIEERDEARRERSELSGQIGRYRRADESRREDMTKLGVLSFGELCQRFRNLQAAAERPPFPGDDRRELIECRDAQNRQLRAMGLPEGLAGFDALVASYQQLAAIDKALATSEPDEDETQDQLDRIEARVNDIGSRVGYHFSAPPTGRLRDTLTEAFGGAEEKDPLTGVSGEVRFLLNEWHGAIGRTRVLDPLVLRTRDMVVRVYEEGVRQGRAGREPFGWVILNRNDAPLGVNGTWCLYPSDGRLVGAALEALNGPDRPPSSAAHQPYRKVLVMLAEPSNA